MTVATVGPYRHLIFPKLTVPFPEDCAECIEIPLDLPEVLFADACPFCLEGRLELFPELSELFLIQLFLIYMNSL